MTSTARPARGIRERSSRVLPVSAAGVALTVAITAVAGGLVAGAPAARGAIVGGGIALAFFLFGSFVVNSATRLAPQQAMLVALTTYTLQVVLVAVAFVVLSASGAVDATLSSGWVAGAVIAATAAWTVTQLVTSARARVPAYDVELPDVPERTSPTPSSRREVGA